MRATTLLLLVATAAAFVFGIEWLYVALGLILLVLLLAEASSPRMPEEAPEPKQKGPTEAQKAQASAYSAGQSFALGLMRGEISHAVARAAYEEQTTAVSGAINNASRKLTKKMDVLEKKIDDLEKLQEGGRKRRLIRHIDDD
ncbi:MAG: hypothetical protein V1881_01675 [Candidatus Micrarchaeota archaeon]